MWKTMERGRQALDEHTAQQLCSKGCHAASPIYMLSSNIQLYGGRDLKMHCQSTYALRRSWRCGRPSGPAPPLPLRVQPTDDVVDLCILLLYTC
jgi:hypothetical protein